MKKIRIFLVLFIFPIFAFAQDVVSEKTILTETRLIEYSIYVTSTDIYYTSINKETRELLVDNQNIIVNPTELIKSVYRGEDYFKLLIIETNLGTYKYWMLDTGEIRIKEASNH